MSIFRGNFRRPGWARSVWHLVIALCAALAANAADYEHNVSMQPGGDADIRLTVPGGQAAQSGFLPVRVSITNRRNKERSWAINFSNQVYGFGNSASSRTIHTLQDCTVPAAATREFLIYVPVATEASQRNKSISSTVEIEGPEVVETGFQLGLGSSYLMDSQQRAPFVVEPGLEGVFRKFLSEEMKEKKPSLTYRASRTFKRTATNPLTNLSVIDPALWPADWRLWSSFTTVILERQKWDLLDTPRRRALLDWVALGGRLYLLVPAKVSGKSHTQWHGAGKIVTLEQPLAELLEYRPELLELDDFSNLTTPGGSLASASFWDLDPGRWQLEGKTGWLTFFIAVFGLLIGPVNLFWLAPQGKRHRLFLTVPAISLGAALTLFGIIAVKDGFGGEGTRRTLVVLFPEENQAAVFQRQISRTGLLGGRNFQLPADTVCDRDTDSRGASGPGLQCWREGDTAWGDWFANRSTQQQTLRRLSPTRERVELVAGAAGEGPVIQSTLATTLRSFVFRDDAGVLWSAAEVPPGTRVSLRRDPAAQLPHAPILRPGQFYALGGASTIAPLATLGSIRWRDDRILYCGRLSVMTLTLP